MDDAAWQAVAGVRSVEPQHVAEVRFVLFDDVALAAFAAALGGLLLDAAARCARRACA